MAWQRGPLPPDTFNWGGVVPKGGGEGFYFADFMGDHVLACPGDVNQQRIEPVDVEWYDNSLTLPPGSAKGATRNG